MIGQDGCDLENVIAEVRKVIPGSRLAGARGQELAFVLPEAARGQFPALPQKVQDEESSVELKFTGYGLAGKAITKSNLPEGKW